MIQHPTTTTKRSNELYKEDRTLYNNVVVDYFNAKIEQQRLPEQFQVGIHGLDGSE